MTDVAEPLPPAAAVAVPGLPGPPPTTQAPLKPPATIVPLKLLPVSAALIIFAIVAIAANWLWALDFLHVAAGGLWTGIDLFVGLIVGPIVGGMSIPARVEFSTRFMPKMLVIMPTLVTLTLAAGWQLGVHLGTVNSEFPNHGWVVASYIVVGVMAVIALGILEPANLGVIFELRKPRPNGEIIAKLMKRFIYTAGVTGAMQIATFVIMTKVATG